MVHTCTEVLMNLLKKSSNWFWSGEFTTDPNTSLTADSSSNRPGVKIRSTFCSPVREPYTASWEKNKQKKNLLFLSANETWIPDHHCTKSLIAKRVWNLAWIEFWVLPWRCWILPSQNKAHRWRTDQGSKLASQNHFWCPVCRLQNVDSTIAHV